MTRQAALRQRQCSSMAFIQQLIPSRHLAKPSARLGRSGLIAVIVVCFSLRGFMMPSLNQDEAILLVYADQILQGRLPHRDFFTVYGPGSFGTVAGAFLVLGHSVESERVVGLLYHLLIAGGVYGLTRSLGRTAALGAAVLSTLTMLPLGVVAFAWLGALSLVIWMLVLLQRPTRGSWFAAGLLAGLVPLWRPEMVVVAGAAAVPFLVRSARVPFSAGFALGLVPITVYVITAGRQMFDNVVLGRMGIDARMDLGDAALSVWLVFTALLMATAYLAARALLIRTPSEISAALLAVTVLPQALQRTDVTHCAFALCAVAPLAFASLASQVRTSRPELRGLFVRAAYVLAVAVAVIVLVDLFGAARHPPVRVSRGGHSVLAVDEDQAAGLQASAIALTALTPERGKVFIGAKDMARPVASWLVLYFLVPELRAHAYYLELAPGVVERPDSGLVNDIRGADVLMLTNVPESRAALLLPHLERGSDAANHAVAEEFRRAHTTEFGTIYVRRTLD